MDLNLSMSAVKPSWLLMWEIEKYKQGKKWPPGGRTYSIGFAECLEVDAVAFQRGKRRVPVAVVCLIVTHCKGLCDGQVGGLQFSSKVVQRVKAGGVPIAHGHRETLDDVSCPPWLLKSLLLDHQLIDTGQDIEKTDEWLSGRMNLLVIIITSVYNETSFLSFRLRNPLRSQMWGPSSGPTTCVPTQHL